jgi:hypothetical protein
LVRGRDGGISKNGYSVTKAVNTNPAAMTINKRWRVQSLAAVTERRSMD